MKNTRPAAIKAPIMAHPMAIPATAPEESLPTLLASDIPVGSVEFEFGPGAMTAEEFVYVGFVLLGVKTLEDDPVVVLVKEV